MKNRNYQHFFETTPMDDMISKKSIQGGVITGVTQVVKFTLQFITTIILARILSPIDFGLLAMVTAITGFLSLFKDMGLSMAIIQKKEISHNQISTLFWINILFSCVLMILTIMFSPIVAFFYSEPRLTAIMSLLSITFLFGGLAVQHQSLLKRKMLFYPLAVVEISAIIIGTTTGILLSQFGFGYWAIVYMIIVTEITSTIGMWIACKWKPKHPTFSLDTKKMLSFGGNLTAFNIINYLARNADNILIGRVWGPMSLGYYSTAYSLSMLPINQISAPISSVAIPAMSRFSESQQRMKEYYLNIVTLLFFIALPITICFCIFSNEIIELTLGPKWRDSAFIFKILSISIPCQLLCNTSGWLYISKGAPHLLLKWGTVGVTGIIISFCIGIIYGAKGVAISYSTAIFLWTIPCMFFATRNTLIRLRDILFSIYPEIVSASFTVAVILLLKKTNYTNPYICILLSATCFLTIYIPIVFYIFKKKNFYFSIIRALKS